MKKCPYNKCGDDLKHALEKIENDSKYKQNAYPVFVTGPTGPTGPSPVLESANLRVTNATGDEIATLGTIPTQNVVLKKNIEFNAENNSFTILKEGTYLANWHVIAANTSVNDMEVVIKLVRISSTPEVIVGESTTGALLIKDDVDTINGMAVIDASVGDTFILRNDSVDKIELEDGGIFNVELIVTKIM